MRTGGARLVLGFLLVTLALVTSACEGVTSAPISSLSVASSSGATVTPGHSGTPTASTTSATSTTATQPDPRAVLAKLASRMKDPKATYQVDEKLTLSIGTFTETINGTTIVAGPDMQYDTSGALNDVKMSESAVFKAGRVYVRSNGGAWTTKAGTPSRSPRDLWITALLSGIGDKVAFDKAQDTQLTFKNAGPIPYSTMKNEVMTIDRSHLDPCVVVVKADGTPVSLTATITGEGTVAGAAVKVTGSTTVTFSKFGAKLSVKAPM